MKVVITGGTGNLGSKLAAHLLSSEPGQWSVHIIEHPDFYQEAAVPDGATVTIGDVGDTDALATPGSWCDALDGADALVHFSAVNPYPNADWAECGETMDHTVRFT